MTKKTPQEAGQMLGLTDGEAAYITHVEEFSDGSGWHVYWAKEILEPLADQDLVSVRKKVPQLDERLRTELFK